jgi:hypothetical protein
MVLNKITLKASPTGVWAGVPEDSTDTRTFDLELPRGQGTVKCGKYFEVRYFLNIIVGTSSKSKLVILQLPIVLIHMNSLDVVPNSVAQVAKAIEEKRARSRSVGRNRSIRENGHRRATSMASAVQGRAFAAPRMQSQERAAQEHVRIHECNTLHERGSRPSLISSPVRTGDSTQKLRPTRKGDHGQADEPPPRFRIPTRSSSRDLLQTPSYSQSSQPYQQFSQHQHHRQPPNWNNRTTPRDYQPCVEFGNLPVPPPATTDYTTGPVASASAAILPIPPLPPQAQARTSTIDAVQQRIRKIRSSDSVSGPPIPTRPPPGLTSLPPPVPAKDLLATNMFTEMGLNRMGSSRENDRDKGVGGPFRKMRSAERWKGGWIDRSRERDHPESGGYEQAREREQNRGRDKEKERSNWGNWI